MGEEDIEEDIKVNYPISFLWDKWKHHDGLAYSRWASSMVLEAAVLGATVLSLRIYLEEADTIRLILLIFMSVIWLLAAYTSYGFIKCQEIDVRVRNTFNKRIVEQMLRDHLLEGDKELWRFKDYISGSKNNTRGSEDDNKHPINLWHTPLPFNEGKDVRATKINSQLMGIFLKLNVAMAYICLCFTANFVTMLLLD